MRQYVVLGCREGHALPQVIVMAWNPGHALRIAQQLNPFYTVAKVYVQQVRRPK